MGGLVSIFQFKTGVFSKTFDKFSIWESKDQIAIQVKCFWPHEMFPIEGLDETPIVALGSFDTIVFHKVEGGQLFFRIEKPLSAK